MSGRLLVRVVSSPDSPLSDGDSDKSFVIGEQTLSNILNVKFDDLVETGKLCIFVSGPSGCTIFGCLIKDELSLNIPVSQLLVGILSCSNCSQLFRDGIALRLSISLHNFSTKSPIAKSSIFTHGDSSFLSEILQNGAEESASLKFNNFELYNAGQSNVSAELMTSNWLKKLSFQASSMENNFSNVPLNVSQQILSNFLTLTIKTVNGDKNNRSIPNISSTQWPKLSLIAKFSQNMQISFCSVMKNRLEEDDEILMVAFIDLEIFMNENETVNEENEEVIQVNQATSSGAMDTLPRLQRYPRVSSDIPLPPGWEARLDSNGRMFFVDHISRITTWKRPSLEAVNEIRGLPNIEEQPQQPVPTRLHSESLLNVNQNQEPPASPASSVATAAAARQRDQFVRRNESFRRLIADRRENRANAPSRSNQNRSSYTVQEQPQMGIRELMENPAVRFLTRPDLNTFLNANSDDSSEAVASKESYRQSSVVRHIVKQIRKDPHKFIKYQHNRELVHFLCGLADRNMPLPEGWDIRTDSSGRPFFLDHTHRATTYIDPRLPVEQVPDQTSRSQSNQIPTAPTRNVAHRSQVSLNVNRTHDTGVAMNDANIDYSDRVVAWLKQPDIENQLARYPQFRQSNSLAEKIKRIIRHGRQALDHYSNDVHVAQLLSFFESDINASNLPSAVLITNGGGPHSSKVDNRYDCFRTKVRNLYKKMASKGYGQGPAKLRLDIRRDHVLEDSFTLLTAANRRTLQKSRLIINFNTEDGLDYGGPQREFFFLVSQHLFNPYYGLFEYATSNSYAVHISPMSQYVDNAMQWYRFAGRVIALSLIHQHLLDAFFTPTFFKLLLRRRPSLDDLETEDPQFYQSLIYIRDNDITDLDLGLTFSQTEEVGGKIVEHELKNGGKTLNVTEKNKTEYIQLLVDWRIQRSIIPQARQLQMGFAELLDPKLIETFEAKELELLIAGIPEIDLDDWRQNTEYRGGYYDSHPIIRWFWMSLERMDNDHRLRLLQFVTGTASLPYEGFAALRGAVGHSRKFCIERWGNPDALPRAHTCFNRLDLPPYPSFQVLFDKLLLAINESQSFGIE